MGGLLSANLAVRAVRGQLPPPLAVMAVEPAKTWPQGSMSSMPLEDLSLLPENLLLLAVAGDDDNLAHEIDARKIYLGATNVPASNKDYVRIFSDDHGSPALLADHRAPTAPTPDFNVNAMVSVRGPMRVDALDYYGTWKLFDGLADAVFRGMHREYALGNTPQQRFMGYWSDRVPVRELMIGLP
jgi:hypothetical protein